jgi:hypothetical protein
VKTHIYNTYVKQRKKKTKHKIHRIPQRDRAELHVLIFRKNDTGCMPDNMPQVHIILDCRSKVVDQYGVAIIHPIALLFPNVPDGIQQFLQLAPVVLETVGSLRGHGLPPSFEVIEVAVRRWQAL